MINGSLYVREMKKSIKILLIFMAVLTMYVVMIIDMYDPKMVETLNNFYEIMPELMDAVGMVLGATSLLSYIISYLYGFILLVIPMVFLIIRGNALIAKYNDTGAMSVLLAAPVKRKSIVVTQGLVLISCIAIIALYTTCLELIMAHMEFKGQLDSIELLKVNIAWLCLMLFIAGVCFLASCYFQDMRFSLSFGAGIPLVMYVMQMLANVGDKAKGIRYLTFFTLFDAEGIAAGESVAVVKAAVLLIGAIILFTAGCVSFCRKDLSV
ncbi:MAG: ABC transporter permease subunit [Lachnospiraceae bacterium]|nr:ABC transporter permease subunit [Lachnospiraceae bacterium]